MKTKIWSICLLVLALVTLGLLGGITAFIDPYFHYHAPLEYLQYPLNNQRYQNDGIAANFDYDTIITGSSITTNFLASECDELFDANSVKVSFDNASFTETSRVIRRGFEAGKPIKLVISSMDDTWLFDERGHLNYDCPDYLYDRSPLNDTPYLLNKEIFCQAVLGVLDHTSQGMATTSFDEYSFWGNLPYVSFGRAEVMGHAMREPQRNSPLPFTRELRQRLIENFAADAARLAQEHPDTRFVYFAPPYSIVHWNDLEKCGQLKRTFEAYELATQLLLEVKNIEIFALCADFDTTTNPDLYMDARHYAPEINSRILRQIRSGEYLLTRDNYKDIWQEIRDFYCFYDYDTLFE